MAIALGLLLAATTSPAVAFDVIETSTDTDGVTTVTYNSELQELNYDCSEITVMEADLGINMEAGDAHFVTFVQKPHTFTPKSTGKKQKVEGMIMTSDMATLIDISSLHFDSDRAVYIGNVHFKWKGEVDEDGVEGRETLADYGVNLHLERPGMNGNCVVE